MPALVRLSSTPPPLLAIRSWRVRKANLFPLAKRGACILKRRCLQPMVATPTSALVAAFALSPFDSLSFASFLLSLCFPPFSTALLQPHRVRWLFFICSFLSSLDSLAVHYGGKRWNEDLALYCSYSRIVAWLYSCPAQHVYLSRYYLSLRKINEYSQLPLRKKM